MDDYPVKVRIPRPETSSRLWAVLTIFWIKFLALIPHFIVLALLGIAQLIVFWISQFAVLFTGSYPRSLHTFVTGVLRWQTRVGAFLLNLTDIYPPFSLDSDPGYPVDIDIEYPQHSNRVLAGFTAVIGLLSFLVILSNGFDTSGAYRSVSSNAPFNLRSLLVLPHAIVLAVLGIAAFLVWVVAVLAILFGGSYPSSMHRFVAGVTRWSTRVTAWTYGLIEPYPPFTLGDPAEGIGIGLVPFGPPPLGPGGMPPGAPGSWPPAPPGFGPPAGPPQSPPAPMTLPPEMAGPPPALPETPLPESPVNPPESGTRGLDISPVVSPPEPPKPPSPPPGA